MINEAHPTLKIKHQQGLKRILNEIIEFKLYENLKQRNGSFNNARIIEFIFLNNNELDKDVDKLHIQIVTNKK